MTTQLLTTQENAKANPAQASFDAMEGKRSKHSFLWGEGYSAFTFFDYAVLDSLIDNLIAKNGVTAQEAFNFITENKTQIQNNSKNYWGAKYIFEGSVFAKYIETKSDDSF